MIWLQLAVFWCFEFPLAILAIIQFQYTSSCGFLVFVMYSKHWMSWNSYGWEIGCKFGEKLVLGVEKCQTSNQIKQQIKCSFSKNLTQVGLTYPEFTVYICTKLMFVVVSILNPL